MRASYDSIDNKQKMCEKVNKDIILIQFFHSNPLHWTIQNILLAPNPTQLFCKKLVCREEIDINDDLFIIINNIYYDRGMNMD